MQPIHHTFGPLATRQQFWHAFALQFQPWKWQNGREREQLRAALAEHFQAPAALFLSGREALLALLRTLALSPGEEVILQAYTCAVVPNAIHAANAKAVYVDIDPDTLNLDPARVQQAITPRTRAIICQHTFGIPADVSALRQLCDDHGIMLIEDCAHVVPKDNADSPIGRHGDAVILSFGRDKALSGVSGGGVIARDEAMAAALSAAEEQAQSLSRWAILNLIDYPLRYQWAKWLWPTGLAKVYLHAVRLLGWLPPILTSDEKGGHVTPLLHRLPNACAALALKQWQQLTRLNQHRQQLAQTFSAAAQEHSWKVPANMANAPAPLKFPLFHLDADQLRSQLKQRHAYLDDGWCGAVVNPRTVDQAAVGYIPGTCPNAENVARTILSLPTHPTMSATQAKRLIDLLSQTMQADSHSQS